MSLSIVGARSLKDKRSVVRSFKERVQSRLRVSVAEVGELDDPRRATIGVACVSGSSTVCHQMLGDAARMGETLADAILTDRATEVIPFGPGGRGIQGGIEAALASAPTDDDEDDDDEEEGS